MAILVTGSTIFSVFSLCSVILVMRFRYDIAVTLIDLISGATVAVKPCVSRQTPSLRSRR